MTFLVGHDTQRKDYCNYLETSPQQIKYFPVSIQPLKPDFPLSLSTELIQIVRQKKNQSSHEQNYRPKPNNRILKGEALVAPDFGRKACLFMHLFCLSIEKQKSEFMLLL